MVPCNTRYLCKAYICAIQNINLIVDIRNRYAYGCKQCKVTDAKRDA